MKKFFVICAFALVLGLGSSSKAHAQLNYGYTIPAYGGTESAGTNFTSYGPQSYKDFYSPITGYMSQTSGSINTLYGKGSYTSIYSPYTGYMTESRGTTMTPFGMASYLSYYSPYTGQVGYSRLANSSSANSNSGLVNFNSYYTPPSYFGWNNGWNNGNGNGRHR